MTKINLARETLEKLVRLGYTKEDIAWIGTQYIKVPIDEFFRFAEMNDYNPGYGTEYVPTDLLIVLVDGSWLEHNTYDGSEWWVHRYHPMEPIITRHIKMQKLSPYEKGTSLEGYCI
jgi:hypothetical protein